MTLAEAVWSAQAWKHRIHIEWDMTRNVMAEVHNAGLMARGIDMRKSRHLIASPQDKARLPWDKPKITLTEDDFKPPKDIKVAAEKAGIKFGVPLSEIIKNTSR